MKLMKHLNEEEQAEILEFVKQKTGAGCVVILTGDTELPCEAEKRNEICEGHKFGMLSCNIEDDYIVGILEQTANRIINRNSIKSPYKI